MPDIYARFTAEALHIVTRARKLHESDESRQVVPEHFLYAMLELKRCDARQVLAKIGVNLKEFQNQLGQDSPEWMSGPKSSEDEEAWSYMASSARAVVDEALIEAAGDQVFGVTTRHLLVGILNQTKGYAQQLLSQYNVHVQAVREYAGESRERSGSSSGGIVTRNPFSISPVFIAIVLLTALAGYASYSPTFASPFAVFIFVTGGWVISLALHEFGHAAVAYYAGDHSVVDKGYLTLNPLKYTHGLLSIAMPLLFLIMGGIGLPGGAVYIDRSAIRSERMMSFVSAAGPLANLIFCLLLSIPFFIGLSQPEQFQHLEFWSGVALLILLQITAIIINLIPIPGLDGFNILAPFMPDNVRNTLQSLGGLTFFLIFFLFFIDSPIRVVFWDSIVRTLELFQVDPGLAGYGFAQFRFWELLR